LWAYRLRALRSHASRALGPLRLFLHAFSARASLCARVNCFVAGLPDKGADGIAFPAPENVALGAGPNIAGCGAGAALHESPESHTGGRTVSVKHGAEAEHTCASYTSTLLS
jgi:hypothetical protein